VSKIGPQLIEIVIELGMEGYFRAYKKRFPHKGVESAIKATRNWVENYIKAFGVNPYDPLIAEKIDMKLNELRLKDC